MAIEVRVNGTLISNELTKCELSHETLWSEGTGRSAGTGAMTGSIVARKRTYQLEWGAITQAQFNAIKNALNSADFMPVTFNFDGTVESGTFYRSNLAGNVLGTFGGTVYYHEVSVQLIEV